MEGKSREQNSNFRYNHHSKTSRSTHRKFDPKCQEATPEMLRIEIDNIFKEFLDNPDANEYIFSANLNNLQRKYIHNKAQKLNIISKSFGKEPDRKLHLKKRGKQLSNQSFLLTPSPNSQKFLRDFVQAPAPSYQEMENNVRTLYRDKIVGKLINSPAEIPRQLMISENIEHIRSNLPIFEKKHTIIETIRNNRVVIISSETGSGKTTQVPQFIMEDMAEMRQPCKIICTQPRRISTITAAERVSFERSDKVGGSVGYHIKLEQKYGLQTNLIYCTTGVFLRNLMSGHDGLKNITHIILDEVHERDKLSDFLLICLKQAVSKYTNLKIILMSATVDVNKFLDYFGEGRVLTIPGRLYIIETMFLENILVLTKYMSQKMKAFLKKEKDKKSVALYSVESEVAGKEENLLVDDALEEYMNFSENYDYRIHYEEATAQLSMYYLSEGVSVDYQHSENGRTALMIAAFLADKEFISRLCNMGVLCLAGVKRAQHLNTDELWNTDSTAPEFFAAVLSEHRFHTLIQAIRFDDKTTREERAKDDNLAPGRYLFDSFVEKCIQNYSVGEYLTIPAKYGIKIYAAVAARTFYTHNLEVYAGKQPNGPYQLANDAASVVKRLLKHCSGSGRNVTVDNYFTSIPLAKDLLEHHKITLVRTLRKNKREIPPIFFNTKIRKEKISMFAYGQNSNRCMLISYIPKRHKNVLMLSTFHDDDEIDLDTGDQQKPAVITFYNLTKGAVDVVDTMKTEYCVTRVSNINTILLLVEHWGHKFPNNLYR
nr:probable ATP-dependent RNA helicase YTHDC2 [Leptinotarsa decemlineata]